MVAWFIIAIATLAVFTMVAINGAQMVSNTSDATARIEVARRVDALKAAIEARMGDPSSTGLMYLPAGVQGAAGEGYLPPSGLSVSSTTPFGKKVAYCPFGPIAGTGTTITSANGSTYGVTVTGGFVTAGRPAGYARLSADPELLGYLIAPRGRTGNAAGCDQVVYNPVTQAFEAPGSVVRPLTRAQGVNELRTINAREIVWYVSPSGTGSGATAADPGSLTAALDFYRARLPKAMTIRIQSGSYSLPANAMAFQTGSTKLASRLRLEGLGGIPALNFASNSSVSPAGDMEVENVSFGANSVLYTGIGQRFDIAGTTFAYVYMLSGELVMTGTNTFLGSPSAYWTIYMMHGTRATLTPSSVLDLRMRQGGIALIGARFDANQATINFNQSAAGVSTSYSINPSIDGHFSAYGTRLNLNVYSDYFVYVDGTLELYSSPIVVNAPTNLGIYMENGANVQLYASNIGFDGSASIATVGIYDSRGGKISGMSTSVRASSRCWTGALFHGAADGTVTGQVSTVLAEAGLPALSAAPTKAEVEAHVQQAYANAVRSSQRANNQSSFSCQIG